MVIIDAELTAPPSVVYLFRDITLFSTCFLKQEVLLECQKNERDYYYKWLRNNSSFDYVLDFVNPKTEYGISIRSEQATITAQKIDYENFNLILSKLNSLRSDI